MFEALRDLGRGRWIRPSLGVTSSSQGRLWEDPYSVLVNTHKASRWFWPHDLAVSFDIDWLEPVDVTWLGEVGATVAQPVNLVGTYAGESVVGIGGLIIWAGWNDPKVDTRHFEPPWVIGIPDSSGRVVRWEQKSLEAALDLLYGIECDDINDLAAAVDLQLVDTATVRFSGHSEIASYLGCLGE
jgi:hypothetical protein